MKKELVPSAPPRTGIAQGRKENLTCFNPPLQLSFCDVMFTEGAILRYSTTIWALIRTLIFF